MNDLTHIDLFSGIGGFALAAGWAGFRTVAFCEIEPFCQEVLKARFGAYPDPSGAGQLRAEQLEDRGQGQRGDGADDAIKKNKRFGAVADTGCIQRPPLGRVEAGAVVMGGEQATDSSPSFHRPLLIPDIFALDGTRFRGATLLTGGFPCQPFSHAGKRRGKEDDRAIWPQMLRVIHEARPTWVIGENVSGLISMELDQVLADLEMEGYAARTFHIGAVGVNAPHRRMRVWIVGHDSNTGNEGLQGRVREQPLRHVGQLGGNGGDQERGWEENWLEVATRFCRVDDGLPAWVHARRVARLKALGNAIVPAVAFQIIKAIAEIEGAK